jgi:hypothetical protein
MRAAIVALLVGVAVSVVVLVADVLLGPRIGAPLWTCVSSGPPTAIRTRPPQMTDPSTASFEVLQSYSECTDRVGVPLALVAFVTTMVVTYRRTRRRTTRSPAVN